MKQSEALDILKTGANVFLTGEPGSGKTHTINEYVAWLRSCGIEPAITASTGIAATHIGGMTIHSWSGIGIRRDLSAYDVDAITQNRNVARRIEGTHTLIIDEVSMLSARTLDMVDVVCRAVRRNDRAFGGLQVVLVGDFFQLPPVSAREAEEGSQQAMMQTDDARAGAIFAYHARAWEALNPIICYLSEQHRQEDATFLEFLSSIRRGVAQERHKALLRTRYAPRARDGITQLFSRNANVDAINAAELAKISGETATFQMESRGAERLVTALKRGCLSPERLDLKVGARVMFTRNDNEAQQYANGTLGTVVGFDDVGGWPIVETREGRRITVEPDEWRIEDGGKVLARITQVPLRLAWAMTVHKSQGMSLDAAHMDLSDAFEYGQGYVALSRVRTLSGLSIAGLNARAMEVHPDILARDRDFREASMDAQETFARMSERELAELHGNFVRACGGAMGKGRIVRTSTSKVPTHEITKSLLDKRMQLAEIAVERGMTIGTIVSHIEKLIEHKAIDPVRDLAHVVRDAERTDAIHNALERVRARDPLMPLAPVRALLGDDYSYEEIRLARLFMR